MKIVASSIRSINAKRKAPLIKDLKAESGIDIQKVEKTDTRLSEKQGIKFDYKLTIAYEPKIAEIVIEGSVLTLDENDEGTQVLKDWKKKNLNPVLRTSLFNFILDNQTLKTLQIEEDLNLPKHVPFPKLVMQKDEKAKPANYTG